MDMASISFALNHANSTIDSDTNARKCVRAYQTTNCTSELQHNSLRSQRRFEISFIK